MASTAESFEDLFENAPCGYLTMRIDGRITRVNATMAAWTGYSAQQLMEKRFHDLLTVGTHILFETNFAPLLSMHGFCEEISLDLRTAAGDVLAVSASARVHTDENKKPVSVRVIFVKASERRRYERELVEAREQSRKLEHVTQELLRTERQSSEWREQFIAVLGHDLRNPLASLSGGVRLLRKEMSAERRTLLLDFMQGSIVRMSGLIDNVLDFARGRLGAGIPLDLRRQVMLAPVLDQVVAELRIGVPDRVIETAFDLTVPVACDASRISQLVSNLLGNALTHGSAAEPVRIHASATDGILTIWIANGGDPIPAAALERLFQPFFRGEVRPSQQGLGLGLYIASEIAKAHKGTLRANSTADETRFTFQMPITGV